LAFIKDAYVAACKDHLHTWNTTFMQIHTHVYMARKRWKLLGSVEKANLGKISELVEKLETTFQTERQGWVSMSITGQLPSQKDDDAHSNVGNHKNKKQRDHDIISI